MFRKINAARLFNWLIIAFVILTNFQYKYWKDSERIIAWDVIYYYSYLPATFIYNDLSLSYAPTAEEEVKSKTWCQNAPNGNCMIKTASGMAAMYAPFFAASHLYTKLFGGEVYHPNGYSVPYRFGLIASSIFYFAFGLFFMRKTLQQFFPDFVVICTSMIIAVGTNLFYYVTTEPTMSHAYSFCLLAAFIFYSLKWHKSPSLLLSLLLGFLTGVIALTRPTNAIILLFFILWEVRSFADLKNRGLLFLRNYKWILLMAFVAVSVWIPQLLYWKNHAGVWLYNSYGNEERFFFNDPKIIAGLFSYRKGWLLYTPVMTFALIGIFFLRQKFGGFFLPVLLFTLLNIYIIFSWWSWWYGGGFGLRAMIDSYALLAIPLAAFFYYLWQKKIVVKILTIFIFATLVFFNQFQVAQYRSGAIHWDAMGKKVYWANFGKLEPVPNFQELLEPLDYDKARAGDR